MIKCRVARWYIFKPKIRLGVNFGVSCNERWDYILAIWYILLPFGNLVVIWYILVPFGNLVVIWYILLPFGNLVVIWYMYLSPFWYILSTKIWQP
jgi:hypothetical protein